MRLGSQVWTLTAARTAELSGSSTESMLRTANIQGAFLLPSGGISATAGFGVTVGDASHETAIIGGIAIQSNKELAVLAAAKLQLSCTMFPKQHFAAHALASLHDAILAYTTRYSS